MKPAILKLILLSNFSCLLFTAGFVFSFYHASSVYSPKQLQTSASTTSDLSYLNVFSKLYKTNLFFSPERRYLSLNASQKTLQKKPVTIESPKVSTAATHYDVLSEKLDSLIFLGKKSRAVYHGTTYRLHDTILNDYTIVDFSSDAALLRKENGTYYWLRVFLAKDKKVPSASKTQKLNLYGKPVTTKSVQHLQHSVVKSASTTAADIRQLTPTSFVVNKKLLTEVTSNLSSFLQEASVTPIKLENAATAFKLTYLKKGSLFQQLGLHVHDILLEINHVKLKSPAHFLRAVQQLPYTATPEIKLIRNSQPLTLCYRVH